VTEELQSNRFCINVSLSVNQEQQGRILNLFKYRSWIDVLAVFFFALFIFAAPLFAADTGDEQNNAIQVAASTGEQVEADNDQFDEDDWAEEENWEDEETEDLVPIADPLEPVNRIFFHFNDKLYYWVLKPVARGYKAILPEDVRIVVRNFFNNLLAPTSIVNNLLQGKARKSSEEVVRFVLNSTVGILGLGDFAQDVLNFDPTFEDTGQTLGYYGLGGIIFINWPILGPSNVRDSIGMVGDYFLDPINYVDIKWQERLAIKAYDRVNRTSLSLGDYELFTETAIDPYIAVRDAFQQHRNGKINDK
jgi:phospholipid-binding lipoprotein MlaA